ncbi:hypothetical protein D3C81_1164440 [compost metagenome]
MQHTHNFMLLVTNRRITESVPPLGTRLCALDMMRLIFDKTGTTFQGFEHPWADIVPDAVP